MFNTTICRTIRNSPTPIAVIGARQTGKTQVLIDYGTQIFCDPNPARILYVSANSRMLDHTQHRVDEMLRPLVPNLYSTKRRLSSQNSTWDFCPPPKGFPTGEQYDLVMVETDYDVPIACLYDIMMFNSLRSADSAYCNLVITSSPTRYNQHTSNVLKDFKPIELKRSTRKQANTYRVVREALGAEFTQFVLIK